MIDYKLIRSSRRTIAIQVTPDGDVIVRAPKRCDRGQIEYFIKEKETWILKKQEELQMRAAQRRADLNALPNLTEADYKTLIKKAHKIIPDRVEYYGVQMEVTYGRITIRDQKTRWGSCSVKGNLNFNWRLILAPKEVMDYVIIHELTHRTHMNHSDKFWKAVEEHCPDYRVHRAWLRENGDLLMSL